MDYLRCQCGCVEAVLTRWQHTSCHTSGGVLLRSMLLLRRGRGTQRGGDAPVQRAHHGGHAPTVPRLGPQGHGPSQGHPIRGDLPSWWKLLGSRPPPWRDIANSSETKDFTYHVKNVPPVNIDALNNMAVKDLGKKQYFLEAQKWIRDPSVYNKLPVLAASIPLPQARIPSVGAVNLMVDAQQVAEIKRDKVQGRVKIFPVAEMSKNRFRIIKHTEDINKTFGKDTLLPVNFPSRRQQSAQAASGRFALCLDFSAYFDSFKLEKSISMRMCFASGDKFYCLLRMPMGQRQSVAVAQGATDVLLSFDLPPGVTSQSCIDNVRFVGPKREVLQAGLEFVKRCREVGCTINELPSSNSPNEDRQQLESLIVEQGNWLGAEYDYRRSRQRVADKSIQKIRVSWE
jgi:hypothetical protein